MNRRHCSNRVAAGLFLFMLSAVVASPTSAHCDGLDGPVVTAARQALAAGDVKPVLAWVREQDETEIRQAFTRALAVRRLGNEAKALADLYFFETLVRVHRAGEGAPYTGLRPAGRDLGPAIPAADRALDTGDRSAVAGILGEATNAGLAERFSKALAARRHAAESVEMGRRYVSAYVQYIHYVEGLYTAATAASHGHFEEEPQQSSHAH